MEVKNFCFLSRARCERLLAEAGLSRVTENSTEVR